MHNQLNMQIRSISPVHGDYSFESHVETKDLSPCYSRPLPFQFYEEAYILQNHGLTQEKYVWVVDCVILMP